MVVTGNLLLKFNIISLVVCFSSTLEKAVKFVIDVLWKINTEIMGSLPVFFSPRLNILYG